MAPDKAHKFRTFGKKVREREKKHATKHRNFFVLQSNKMTRDSGEQMKANIP